jgi:hypothetical protein
MNHFLLKIIISALIIAGVSEIAKRNVLVGSLLASLPIISILTMIWLFIETKNAPAVSMLSSDLFWLTMPGLVLFIAFPWFIKHGYSFVFSMIGGLLVMLATYGVFILVKLKWFSH